MALDNITSEQAEGIDNHYPGFFQGEVAQKVKAAIDEVNAREGVLPNAGLVPIAAIDLSTNPTSGDALLVGANNYEFKDAGENLAADTNIGVEIGVDADATQANLIAAVEGTAPVPHPTILKKAPSTEPALSRGTEKVTVISDVGAPLFMIAPSDRPGGAMVPGPVTLGLNAALTSAEAWTVANLNASLGVAAGTTKNVVGSYTIGAAADVVFAVPFAVVDFLVTVRTAAGVIKASGTGTFVVEGQLVTITKGDLTPGDVVSFLLFG